MKKKLIIAGIFVTMSFSSIAQNDIQISHYMFNDISFNPALAGYQPIIGGTLLARQQWIGVDQAPMTQLLTAQMHSVKLNGGVGLSVYNDKLGFEHNLAAKLMYAYTLKLDKKNNLHLGLGAGFVNKTVRGSELTYQEAGDQYALYSDKSSFKPDFDFGIGFSNKDLVAGISVTHLDQSFATATPFKPPRHYYLYGRYNAKVNDKFFVVPSLMVKSSIFITQFDLSTLAVLDKKAWIGASYRYRDAITGLVGVYITENIRLAYSYDYNAGGVKTHSSGSHEICLMATFKAPEVSKAKFF
ncbi:MAG: type IX secretion system membrane protein PorP/SprF [Bacteroidota bacterium]